MYLPNTELTRREPKGDALDVVKVIGQSPIKQASVADWGGASGDHIIVQPAEKFGANEIMPMEVAMAQYTVTAYPPEISINVNNDPHGRHVEQPLSPEQVFAAEARDAGKKAAEKPQAKPKPVTS